MTTIISYYQRPVSTPTYVNPDEPSMAKQEFKKEADINTIMNRYIKTGSLPITPERQAQYGDFTGIDFRDVQDRIARGVQEFELLPSDIRRQFDNSAANYFNFVANASVDELRDMGLLPPAKAGAQDPQTPLSGKTPTSTATAPAPTVATAAPVAASPAPATA